MRSGLPEYLVADLRILMDNEVAHIPHVYPGNLRVALRYLRRDASSCLPDDGEVVHDSVHG